MGVSCIGVRNRRALAEGGPRQILQEKKIDEGQNKSLKKINKNGEPGKSFNRVFF